MLKIILYNIYFIYIKKNNGKNWLIIINNNNRINNFINNYKCFYILYKKSYIIKYLKTWIKLIIIIINKRKLFSFIKTKLEDKK